MPFVWDVDTTPFSTGDGEQPGRFVLRQVDDDEFELVEAFHFVSSPDRVIPVRADLLGKTDLASIPTFMGWFARRHGRHTPAALMHDQLITDRPELLPPELRMPPAEADRLFRQALLACGVPPVKSWVLWTGVVLRTRWQCHPGTRIAMGIWFVAALAGTGLLGYGVVTGQPGVVLVALLAPVPFAALWGRQYVAGLIAGYAFWPVVLGSLPAWLAYQVYWGAEYVVLGIARLWPGRAAPVAPPAPFSKR